MYERMLSGKQGGLTPAERLRIERLEMLDELEEWWLIQVASQVARSFQKRGLDLRRAFRHGLVR